MLSNICIFFWNYTIFTTPTTPSGRKWKHGCGSTRNPVAQWPSRCIFTLRIRQYSGRQKSDFYAFSVACWMTRNDCLIEKVHVLYLNFFCWPAHVVWPKYIKRIFFTQTTIRLCSVNIRARHCLRNPYLETCIFFAQNTIYNYNENKLELLFWIYQAFSVLKYLCIWCIKHGKNEVCLWQVFSTLVPALTLLNYTGTIYCLKSEYSVTPASLSVDIEVRGFAKTQ